MCMNIYVSYLSMVAMFIFKNAHKCLWALAVRKCLDLVSTWMLVQEAI